MKKKLITILTLCIIAIVCAIGLVACNGDDNGSADNRDKQIVSVYNTYVAYAEENGQTPLTYEEWLNSIKGKDGINGLNGKDGLGVKSVVVNNDGHLIITYTDNNSVDAGLVKGSNGQNGQAGKDGKDGADGLTPYIKDGYWWIGETNTNVKAQGVDGKDGLDGNTFTIEISNDGYWVIGGNKTNVKAQGADGKDGENGQDGITPTISISEDGYWVINNEKTSVKAVGVDGKNGQAGKDGNDGADGLTPYIKDGYWWIGETNTNVKAEGTDGKDGADGQDGKDGKDGKDGNDGLTPYIKDGYWWIGETNTNVKAQGTDGKDGADGQDGKDGKDGREIKSAEIDKDGNLIITYKDDTTENLGKIKDNSKCEHEYSDYIITEIGDIGYRKEYYCKKCHEEKSELYIYTDGIEYALSEDGESAYVKSIGTATDKEIVLRNTYQGKPVTNIEYKAFLGCENITKITIWDSITKIKHDAFYGCDNLVDVNYLGTIDSWCEIVGLLGLMNYGTNYVIDGAQTYGMERNLYINGELISDIEITTAKKIEYCAFNGCKNLKSVIIGDSVTEIGSQAFKYCCSLTEVVMGSNITNIGQEAFRDCDSLKSIEIPNGLTVIEDSTFHSCNSPTDISMGENITYIGNFAFDGCYSLKSIEIPNSVTDIRSHAFAYCSNLKSVEIPNSVTYIGSHVFYCCASLTNIVIPNSITSIESYEFGFCSSLKNIEIPNSITSIGNSAFHQCRSLEKVNYLGNIDEWVKIDFGGFNANPLMDSSARLYINNEPVTKVDLTIATTIKAYAFYKCDSITSITIGKQVESISAHITSLEEIKYDGTIVEWSLIEKDENWWYNDKSITIHCADGDITLKK